MNHLKSTLEIGTDFAGQGRQRIAGGYVEFSILNETHVHFFSSTNNLRFLEYFVGIEKPVAGLKHFIREHYAPPYVKKQDLTDEAVIIWNYELELC
jgi:hypothetical protein